MHIVINQSNNVFGMDAENKIFAQSTETITFDVTFNDPQATLQGLYCALLSDGGKTLALTTISENKAVLDTNTIECVEYVAQWSIGTTRHAFLVVGESTKPLAIIDVEVAQNPLEGLMPPTESAPSYPTSAELQKILNEMTAQAQRAEDAVEATEKAQKAVAQYIDVTFPTKVEQAQKTLENATTSGVNSVTQRANQAVGALDQKQTQIISNIEGKAQAVNEALDGKLATAQAAINDAVGKAETAKGDAVKAQGEASKSAEQASTSASNASKSAEEAQKSAEAIGDVGGRLNAVETSVAQKAPKMSNYLRGMFDYTFVETKYPYWIFFAPCHDGWMFNENYGSKPRFHVSSTGKITQIMTGHSSVTIRLLVADTNNNTTRFYETLSGKHYLTTISGVGDGVTISRVEVTAFPTEAIGAYTDVYGIVLKNGFIVCTNGHILDSKLAYFGSINCSATKRPFTQVLRVGDNAVRYFDTSTKKQTKLTIADDGTLAFEVCYYEYSAQTNELYYMFDSRGNQLALLINGYATKASNGTNGAFYKNGNEWLPIVWRGSSRFGFVCNGQDLFYIGGSANNASQNVVQHTFNLVDTFERRESFWLLYEDATGNFIIVEATGTIYAEGTGYLHVFKYKEA